MNSFLFKNSPKENTMSKLHVTDDGRVLPCSATIKVCKYGSREDGNRHFNNSADAEAKAAEILLKRYDTFSSFKRKENKETLPPREKRQSASATLNNRSLSLPNSLNDNRFGKVPNSSILREEFAA